MERILDLLLSPFTEAHARPDLVLDAMVLMPWWFPHVLSVSLLGLVTCLFAARRARAERVSK